MGKRLCERPSIVTVETSSYDVSTSASKEIWKLLYIFFKPVSLKSFFSSGHEPWTWIKYDQITMLNDFMISKWAELMERAQFAQHQEAKTILSCYFKMSRFYEHVLLYMWGSLFYHDLHWLHPVELQAAFAKRSKRVCASLRAVAVGEAARAVALQPPAPPPLRATWNAEVQLCRFLEWSKAFKS